MRSQLICHRARVAANERKSHRGRKDRLTYIFYTHALSRKPGVRMRDVSAHHLIASAHDEIDRGQQLKYHNGTTHQ